MRTKIRLASIVVVVILSFLLGPYPKPLPVAAAAEPIVLGLPTSMVIIEPQQSKDAVEMAVEEVNAAGGVNRMEVNPVRKGGSLNPALDKE